MARIEEFDVHSVQHIEQEINDILRQVGEAHGINLELSRIRYDRYGFKGYIEAQTIPEDQRGGSFINMNKKYGDEFLRNCNLYGLEPSHLGQTLHIGTRTFTLVGLKSRARIYKFICRETHTDKIYRFNIASIKTALHLV